MKPETIADRLGRIKVQIDQLKEQEQKLKDQLIETGVEKATGRLFSVSVVRSTVTSIDYKGLLEKLKPSQRILTRFTILKDRVQVRVTPIATGVVHAADSKE